MFGFTEILIQSMAKDIWDEGREEGRQEGRQEERQAMLRQMLANASILDVSRITGISEEEIRRIVEQ